MTNDIELESSKEVFPECLKCEHYDVDNVLPCRKYYTDISFGIINCRVDLDIPLTRIEVFYLLKNQYFHNYIMKTDKPVDDEFINNANRQAIIFAVNNTWIYYSTPIILSFLKLMLRYPKSDICE